MTKRRDPATWRGVAELADEASRRDDADLTDQDRQDLRDTARLARRKARLYRLLPPFLR